MPRTPYIIAFLIAAVLVVRLFFILKKGHSLKGFSRLFTGRGAPGRILRSIDIRPGVPFDLAYTVDAAAPLKAFFRYQVQYLWDDANYGDDEEAFGLALEGAVHLQGTRMMDLAVGTGDILPGDMQRRGGISYHTRFARRGDRCSRSATVPLCRMEQTLPGAEVRLQGTVTVSGNVSHAIISVMITR